ncbi:MAG TPA: ATP-binding cassette domain-containing protein [Terriglobales bacterium]|nr:ATP-binding cassette domain-containing protein [Terriglobales bacterium]
MAAPPSVTTTEVLSGTQASAPYLVVFEDVVLAFEDTPVLNGISFRLSKGETKAIFGVAGSGKSTILKLTLGLLKPDSGHIYVLGEEITERKEEDLFELRRKIGMVFQESALFDSLTVRENVAFRLLEEGNVTEEQVDRPVREVLSFVELENTVDMYPSELSGGMRRRVAIARAMITRPELMLYDSPTGGLDPVTSTTIIELIIKQRDVFKTSSLLVTHRLQDAFMMATHYFDRKSNHMQPLPPGMRSEVPMGFLILRDGKIIFDGGLGELVHTQDEYIREYIS